MGHKFLLYHKFLKFIVMLWVMGYVETLGSPCQVLFTRTALVLCCVGSGPFVHRHNLQLYMRALRDGVCIYL